MTTLKEEDVEFKGQYAKGVFDTLLMAYRPYLVQIFFCLLAGLIGRALILSNTNLVGLWVDSFCIPSDTQICQPRPSWTIGFGNREYLFAMGFVTLAGFLLTVLFRIGFSRLSAKAVSQLYDEVTFRTSRYPMSFFDKTPVGRIVTRFSSDYGNVFRLFGGPLAEFGNIIFDLIVMVFLVTVASPYYLPVCIVIAGLNYFIYRLNRETLRKERRDLSRSRSPSIAHFAETTQGASVIRTFSRQKPFFRRFSHLNEIFLKHKLSTFRRILFFSLQMSTLTASLLFFTGCIAYWLIQDGRVSIGSVGVALSFITLSGNTIQMFFEWLSQFEEGLIGVERLDNYLRRDLEPGFPLPLQAKFQTGHAMATQNDERSTPNDGTSLPEGVSLAALPNAKLEVKNLWLQYQPELPFVLKGVSFTVAPGERLGVIGRTGSGKSSLIQAMFYLYPLAQGEIAIAGRTPQLDLPAGPSAGLASESIVTRNTMPLADYRRSIALISQDSILLRGTLRENLTLHTSISDDEMRAALEKVGLSHWLAARGHDGLDMRIEERGRNLSLGERQLVCMARCLLQQAPVVVMDEATSSVDPQSEEILVQATHQFFRDKTQIIVAHRLTTLQHCHRILWLQAGEVKMLGKPHEVLPVFERSQLTV